jgi:CysZ protein
MSHVEGHESSLSIGSGLSAFAGGIGFIITTPRVWIFALVPMVVMCVVTLLLAGLFVWGGVSLTGWVLGEPESTWGRVGAWLLNAMVVLVSLLVSAVVAMSVAQPLSGFALEAVADRQEFALTGRSLPRQPFFASMLATTRIVMLTLLFGGTLLIILLIATLLFPPIAVVTVPLKFIICAWLLAWDFLDYPMSLRGMGLRARLAWVRRNLDAFTTFGVCWAMLVIVPGIVLILLPMGVAGAARMVVEDEQRE